MTSNELLDPSLVHGMQILKLMHCWKFLNVQAIWGDNIWKSREKAEVDIFRVREIFKERTNVSLRFMWTSYVFLLFKAGGTALPPQSSCTWLCTVCSIKAAFTCPQHWVDPALLSCQDPSNGSIEPYICCATCLLPLYPWYHCSLLDHYRLRALGSRNCAMPLFTAWYKRYPFYQNFWCFIKKGTI